MPCVRRSFLTVSVGWAPLSSHSRMRSSLRTIVEGLVCALYWPTVSSTRPSRGERWSATTTRHTGSFFPPTRVSLSRTATAQQGSGFASAATLPHERVDVRHLAAPELLHD